MNIIFTNIRKIFGRWDFILLTFFVIAINIPYIGNNHIPYHDGQQQFELFYFFYNHLFFNAELAQWMPFDIFGFPAQHEQVFSLTPMTYLSMLAGWLFKIKDVLFLFKITIIGEQLVLLLGTYLLANYLFQKRSTIFIVCLAAVANPYWLQQLLFDLRVFYMFPLAVYFYLIFFQEKKPEFLWITGITFFAWVMGCSQYCIFLWIFLFFIMGFVLFLQDKSIWRCLLQVSQKNILFFLTFMIVSMCFYYQLGGIKEFANFLTRGADGKNDLQTFLTWGGIDGLKALLTWLISGFHHTYTTIYVGILPLIFFIYSTFKVRNKYYASFLISLIVIFWLFCGGIFSNLVYFFPGMDYFRHINYTYGLIKLLIIICAGFGLEHFWLARLKTKTLAILISLGILIFAVDSLRLSGFFFKEFVFALPKHGLLTILKTHSSFQSWGLYLLSLVVLIILSGLVYGLKHKVSEAKLGGIITALLIAPFLFDIINFQYSAYEHAQKLPQEYQELFYTYQVNELSFQKTRTREPIEERQKDSYSLITRPDTGTHYTSAYSFTQFDPCLHSDKDFYVHLHPKRLSELLTVKNGNIDRDLAHILGCHAPKLRLISKASFYESLDEAKEKMRGTSQLYNQLILHQENKNHIPLEGSLRDRGGSIASQIAVKKFNNNELIVDVNMPRQNGAWLVYADSYHKGWKATVNGLSKPIFPAYLAFKAVYLDKGKNTVHFFFHNGFRTFISYAIAFFGLIAGFILIVLYLLTISGRFLCVKIKDADK